MGVPSRGGRFPSTKLLEKTNMQNDIEGPAEGVHFPAEFLEQLRHAKPTREPGMMTLKVNPESARRAADCLRNPIPMCELRLARPTLEVPPTTRTQTQLIQSLLEAVRPGGTIIVIL
jgi:hypothetical protein